MLPKTVCDFKIIILTAAGKDSESTAGGVKNKTSSLHQESLHLCHPEGSVSMIAVLKGIYR